MFHLVHSAHLVRDTQMCTSRKLRWLTRIGHKVHKPLPTPVFNVLWQLARQCVAALVKNMTTNNRPSSPEQKPSQLFAEAAILRGPIPFISFLDR